MNPASPHPHRTDVFLGDQQTGKQTHDEDMGRGATCSQPAGVPGWAEGAECLDDPGTLTDCMTFIRDPGWQESQIRREPLHISRMRAQWVGPMDAENRDCVGGTP